MHHYCQALLEDDTVGHILPHARGLWEEMALQPASNDQYLSTLWPEIAKYQHNVVPRTFDMFHNPSCPLTQGNIQDSQEPICIDLMISVTLSVTGHQQESINLEAESHDEQLSVQTVVLQTERTENHSSILLDKLDYFIGNDPLHDNTIDNIRKLKGALMKYNNFLHEVLFCYTHMKSKVALPSTNQIRNAIDDITTLLESVGLAGLLERFQRYRKHVVTSDHILCAILGLNKSLTDWFLDIPTEEREHRTDQYLIEQMLDDQYFIEFPCDETTVDITEDNFIKLGFRKSRARVLMNLLNGSPFRTHHSLIYWAKKMVRDAFQYDILLNNTVMELCGTMAGADRMLTYRERKGRCEAHELTSEYCPSEYIVTKSPFEVQNFPHATSNEEPSLVLYHGTDFNSAVHIVDNGIHLGKGSEKLNFSDGRGFYLTTDYKVALNWAMHTQFSPHCAVLAFKVPIADFAKYNGFDLSADIQEWKDVIAYNRCGRDRTIFKPPADTKKKYHLADYVEGMVCVNGGQFDVSKPMELRAGNTREFCILSQDMADAIGHTKNISMCVFSR